MTHARSHTCACNYTHAHAHSHRHSPDRPDRCIDPPAVCSPPPSWSPLLMRALTPESTSLHSLQLLHCSHNKQTTAANSVQWTLQLLVSDAWTDCTGSLILARLARAGYRFACFLDAQGTPSLRIRVGQRGQGTRRSAARRGSVVAAIGISQNHMRLVARGRIGSGDGLLRW